MRRRAAALWGACLLCIACAARAEYAPGCLMEPPEEVRDHIESHFSAYTLEDYCEIEETPEGDFGFALLTAGEERMLVGYHERDGKMTYGLKSHGAVMQGKEEAWFDVPQAGKIVYEADGTSVLLDGLSFWVTRLDDAGESYQKSICYHWEDGGFKLTCYWDMAQFAGTVNVSDGELHFVNVLEGWDFGKVYGTVQRNLRHVNYEALPKTIEEARKEITLEPDLPQGGQLEAKSVKFTGGKKYPVYTGPGEAYARSGNGKGLVSTNDWIQVFGQAGDYILIQYDISAERYRFGWIEASALPRGERVERLALGTQERTLTRACVLTDDPLISGAALCTLKAGDTVIELSSLGEGWAYVEVEKEGARCCGCVPAGAWAQ